MVGKDTDTIRTICISYTGIYSGGCCYAKTFYETGTTWAAVITSAIQPIIRPTNTFAIISVTRHVIDTV
jgi:hypothetical protein